MRDVAKFNVGWAVMLISLKWTYLAMLPLIVVFLAYLVKAGLLSSTSSPFDPITEAFSIWGNMVWVCLAAFWARALTAFTAPDEGTKQYEDAPLPYFFGITGLFIFELLVFLGIGIHAAPGKWPTLLEIFSLQTFTLLGGMALGLTYGKTFGRNQRGRETGLGLWLLQRTRSVTVGGGFRGPRRYSL